MAVTRRSLLGFIIPSTLVSLFCSTKAKSYEQSISAPNDTGKNSLTTEGKQLKDGLTDSALSRTDAEFINVRQPYKNSVERSLNQKLSEIASPGDFSGADNILSAMVQSDNSIQVFNYSETFTLTVGTNGHYKTIADAISGAVRMRPLWKSGRSHCLIKLLKNYVLDQQLVFDSGEDLSWIKIIAVDDIVYANTLSFTESVRTYYDNKYLFFFRGQVRSPVFAFQIEETRDDSDVCAFLVTEGARLAFGPYSGARKFYVGIDATFGSEVIGLHNGSAPDSIAVNKYQPKGYYLCDFSYSRYTAARFIDGVRVHLPLSLFEYCLDPKQQAVLCIYGTNGNFQGSSVSYSKGIGWNIRDNCTINIRDHKTIYCKKIGISSIHGSFINARCHHTEESKPSISGQVKEPNIKKGLYGCGMGIRCESAAIVEVAGNDIRNCGKGIQAATGATISGKASDLSGCQLAFQGYSGSTLSFPRLWANDVGKLLELYFGSVFTSWTVNSTMNSSSDQKSYIHLEGGSKTTFHHANLEAKSDITIQDGSDLSITSSHLKISRLFSTSGSRSNLNQIDWEQSYKKQSSQLNIKNGSFINIQNLKTTDGEVITSNVVNNTLSSSGAIFMEE